MPTIQSMGSGYYNYYNMSSRYQCDTPYKVWYNQDLEQSEVMGSNRYPNKDSENADLYRKLVDTYASAAVSNRSKYSTVADLRNALEEKYGASGAYAHYSAEERNAMLVNELSMTCFGTIGSHSGMGGGDVLADPHLKGAVTKYKKQDTEYCNNMLGKQISNVFQNRGINMSLFGNNRFLFSMDPLTKLLSISVTQADDRYPLDETLIKQMEDAFNSSGNASKLFSNILREKNMTGEIPTDMLAKYLLMNDFESITGEDIRTYKQTEEGFINDKGKNALDVYKESLKNTDKVSACFKGAAFDYFNLLVSRAMNYDISKVNDLVLTAGYQNGVYLPESLDGNNVSWVGSKLDLTV